MIPHYREAVRIALVLLASTVLQAVPVLAQDKPAALEKPAVKVTLTLEQAIATALEKSPVLAASSSRAYASEASRSQVGALPNPELSIEAENIYGDNDGFENAEVTYSISQLVELPGKRGNRIKIADAEKTKAHFAHDAARLDLIYGITVAYAELAAVQQDVHILGEEHTLASEVLESVAAKVEAGREPPIQKNKAEIERTASQIALERARRTLASKKQALSALMGGGIGDFTVTMGSLPILTAPEPLESYTVRLPQTPDVKSLDVDVVKAKSSLSLEKANAVPDPTFDLGVREFREDDSQALVAGISIPIPVFNMNRAGIKRATHDLDAAQSDHRGAQLSLETALIEIYGNFSSAYGETTALKNTVLPGAEEAFRFAREGYEAGKFGYLDVLDAQRTLFDARKQFNQSVLDYHRQRAAIERMTAAHLEQNTTKEENDEAIKN